MSASRVLLVAIGLVLFAPSAVAGTPLRIVTFNAEILTAPQVRAGQLQKFRFDHARALHLERVADVIEVLRPDVLNLVEVTSVEAVDALAAILAEKGLDEYRGYHVESNDGFTGMDVGVLSRVPLDEVDGETIRTFYSEAPEEPEEESLSVQPLEPVEPPKWRESFDMVNFEGQPDVASTSLSRNSVYFLTVGGWRLGFLGLHLKSNPSDDSYANPKRMAEALVARRVIQEEIVRRGYLPVVLGDLNDYDPDVPDRDDSRSTNTTVVKGLKNYDDARPGDELVNAAQWIVRQADRYTSHWDWNENGAADGEDVFTMIDHVLLPKQLGPHVRRVFIARCVSLDTSDHYPVVVDLELPPGPAMRR